MKKQRLKSRAMAFAAAIVLTSTAVPVGVSLASPAETGDAAGTAKATVMFDVQDKVMSKAEIEQQKAEAKARKEAAAEKARKAEDAERSAKEEAERVAAEAAEAPVADESYDYGYVYYDDAYCVADYGTYENGDGLTRSGGVNYYNGTRETWYSSNTLRHYRTDEWTADDEGCYRTDDGYYVVASSDYPEGTVIETSKGQAMVLDSGCDSGTVDFYTRW